MTLNLKSVAMLLTVPALLFVVTCLEEELMQIRGGEALINGATQMVVKLDTALGRANETISRLSSLVEEASAMAATRADEKDDDLDHGALSLTKERSQQQQQQQHNGTTKGADLQLQTKANISNSIVEAVLSAMNNSNNSSRRSSNPNKTRAGGEGNGKNDTATGGSPNEDNVTSQALTANNTTQTTMASNHTGQAQAASSSSSTLDNRNPMDDFNLCRIQPDPVVDEARVKMPGLAIPLTFQCAGKDYHDVSDLLEQVILSHAKEDLTGQWGRKRKLIPPPSNNNNNNKGRAILIMGNSHTRQLAATLLCQYRHQIINTTDLYPLQDYPMNGVHKIELQHNLTIYSITNNPLMYNSHWQSRLETIIQRPIASMDAIVLGHFNTIQESKGRGFHQFMQMFDARFPELEMDFEHYGGPTVLEMAEVVASKNGSSASSNVPPILHVSMFATYARRASGNMMAEVQKARPDANVQFIDGRRYIEALKHLPQTQQYPKKWHECACSARLKEDKVGQCIADSENHRCLGSRGGHPDLIAWDVVQALSDIFATNDNNNHGGDDRDGSSGAAGTNTATTEARLLS